MKCFPAVEAVLGFQPLDHFHVSDAERIDEGSYRSRHHDVFVVFESRPGDRLALDQIELKGYVGGRFNARTGDLSISLQGTHQFV